SADASTFPLTTSSFPTGNFLANNIHNNQNPIFQSKIYQQKSSCKQNLGSTADLLENTSPSSDENQNTSTSDKDLFPQISPLNNQPQLQQQSDDNGSESSSARLNLAFEQFPKFEESCLNEKTM